jgi:peroxiredoxin family protein
MNGKKLSIIAFSGDFDKAIAAFTLATGAAAVGYEVNLFFTFWGFNIIKRKKGRRFTGKGFMARMFNFLMGGFRNLPLSRLNFVGASPRLMTGLMKKRNVATLKELVSSAVQLGVNFYACEMSMVILGLKLEDLIPEIKPDILGVAKFLEISDGGETLFI